MGLSFTTSELESKMLLGHEILLKVKPPSASVPFILFNIYFRHINVEVYALYKRILKRSSSTQNSPTDSYQFTGVYIMSVINRRKLSIIIDHLDTVKKKATEHPVRAWNNLSEKTV